MRSVQVRTEQTERDREFGAGDLLQGLEAMVTPDYSLVG